MSTPAPSLSINVDVTNPGQFFACCGLLELADRLNDQSLAWFEPEVFCISGSPPDLICQFLCCSAEPIGGNGEDDKVTPIYLGKPFNLRLDWWKDPAAEASKLKTWSAGQKVTDLLNNKSPNAQSSRLKKPAGVAGMREHFKVSWKKYPTDWLRETQPIDSPKAFCFDSRLSRNNALDLGHVESGTMSFSPAVDVLALVGLQRFRPRVFETWTRNRYCTWNQPLPVDIAAVAGVGLIPQVIKDVFEFPIKPRDAQGRYKLFGHAQPVRRSHV